MGLKKILNKNNEVTIVVSAIKKKVYVYSRAVILT